MRQLNITDLFDEVIRRPESHLGMNVEATAKLLAEAIKGSLSQAYEAEMLAMEEHYVEQFLNTASVVPGFAERIRRAMRLYR